MAKGQSQKSKTGWPLNVRVISMEALDELGIDDNGQLYWQGKKVRTASTLELTTDQGIGAWLLIGSAVILAAIEVLRIFGVDRLPM